MPEKQWKAQERRIARLLNARRNPSGNPVAPDVENASLVGEIKVVQELPKYLVNAVLQSKSKVTGGRLPVVVLVGMTSPLDLLIMDLRDYRDWYVGIPRKERR